jgi:DNA-binding transcriptional ArsR family regulator
MAPDEVSFCLLTDKELETLPDPEWLVENVLPLGSFAVLFGAPGAGKSFVAFDMAWSIAAGLPWQGRSVKKGWVLYIAAEGRSGIKPRRRAWNQEHSTESCPEMHYLAEPVQLANDDHLTALLQSIERLTRKPIFIVIDTLARCFVGLDENQSKDMGRLVAAADRLRAVTGATVLMLHHAGKARGRQKIVERGSSALAGAADVMMSLAVVKSGQVLKCEKQKESEPFEQISFRLKAITFGDGLESCVVVSEHIDTETTLGEKHHEVLEALAGFSNTSARTGEWQKSTTIPERTFYRLLTDLLELGAIDKQPEGKHVRYTLNLKWLEKFLKPATVRSKPRTTAGARSVLLH